ncbi:MAG: PLP-dependent aminotransferase family protein [Bryobacterales bacterium]|nr:PLP-dependent aminotransferase family protein [Bryobacteraceae bacterium]MDW8352921.1 PLP-dependent aminotransferase family protein [Bryobacterales bacterium]
MWGALRLDPGAETPLYRQLASQIRELIRAGRLASGDRLPATRELAARLGLNRSTVNAAYALLESEGLIQGHVGRGSFVLARLPARGVDWAGLLEPAARLSRLAGFPAGEPTGVISFATSRPDESLFPLEEFRATCREVVDSAQARELLQLGSPSGYGPLREYLLAEARREGVARSGDDILITNGCQQALDLLQRVLAPAGETVALEEPASPGLRSLFLRAGVRLVGVPIGDDGLELSQLERILKVERPRLLVLTPNFQNPTGLSLSREARHTVAELVRAAGAVLVENDIYGELRYSGAPAPTLKQLDESGDTVLVRSFSKIAFPGLRVGWLIGPRALVARLAEAKQWTDLHTDQLSQAVLLRFAVSGRLARHRERVRAAGSERLAVVLAACRKHLPPGTFWTRPQGGMNLWVRLPEPLDAAELLPRARQEQVTYLPGKFFEVSRPQGNGLRISFAAVAPAAIRTGIAVLGRIFQAEMDRARAAGRLNAAPALV